MFSRDQLKEGMTVRSSDGEKLGKIFALGATELQIEKGIFFKKDYVISYDRVLDVRNGECFLALRKDELDATSGKYLEGYGKPAGLTGTGVAGTERTMELREEELEIERRRREAGEVRVSKDVVTEERQVTVPVTKEHVVVERVPGGNRPAGEVSAAGKESISIPVTEEEIEIKKRPVVKEEVRIRAEPGEEQRTFTTQTRREVAEVEGEKDLPPGTIKGDDRDR